MKKKNWPLIIGLLFVSMSITVKDIFNINEVFVDFLMGFGIGLELVGLICLKHFDNLKNLKNKLFFK